jgi:hypothetical protein
MKMTTRFPVLAILALFSCSPPHQPDQYRRGEGMEEDMQARRQWENERLADPATGKIPFGIRQKELAYAATLPTDASVSSAFGSNLRTTTNTWDFRGPWNVGGRTRALAIDVANENNILAGGASGGMWRSTDGGVSWTRTTPLPGYPGVNAIAQDVRPGHQNVWYYLSGEAYGTSASGGSAFYLGNGMYKSLDSGVTWTSVTSTVSGTPQSFDNVWDVTWNVVTDPSDTVREVVYAAVYDAIYRSTNGGTSWARVRGWAGTQSSSSYFTDVAVTTTGVVYCTLSSDGLYKGIWRSADGITYYGILPANFPVKYDRLAIGIDPNDENTVYFFGPTPGYGRMSFDYLGDTLWNSLWRYTYLSGTGSGTGGAWTDLSANLPGTIGLFNGLNTQGGYDVIVKVKPGAIAPVYIGGTNIFRSLTSFNDSLNTEVIGGYEIGATLPWVYEYPGHHPDQHAFAFLPSNPNVMYSAHDGGISKTLDNMATPVIWDDLNTGYITTQFYAVAMDHATTSDILTGGMQDNGSWCTVSASGQAPWVYTLTGDGCYTQIADSGSRYYFSKQNAKLVMETLDTAGAMTAYQRIDPAGGEGYIFVTPFRLDPNDNNRMYLAGGKRLWRNDSLSYIPLSNQYDSIAQGWTAFPDTTPLSAENITAVAVSKTPANRVYYGTNRGHVYRLDNAHSGTPAPVDITAAGTFPAAGYVSCLAIDPTDADKMMVVFSNYNIYSLFYTSDGGTNWDRVGGNLEQFSSGAGNGPSCRWATILPVSGGTVYLIGTSTGLYGTDTLIHNGTTWVQQGANTIGSVVVDMMDARMTDGLVAVATHGNGVFSEHITSPGQITTVRDLPGAAAGLKLYPNPVQAALQVSWPGGRGQARMEILNDMGQRVRQVSQALDAAGHAEIGVGDLPKGLYYLRMTTGRETIAKAFVKL